VLGGDPNKQDFVLSSIKRGQNLNDVSHSVQMKIFKRLLTTEEILALPESKKRHFFSQVEKEMSKRK
jgi:hypothetical protein